MLARCLIIDGNNLLHHRQAWVQACSRDFETARRCLVQELESCAGVLADRIVVVFDGVSGAQKFPRPNGSPVEVFFSPSHLTADSLIERFAFKTGKGQNVLVITSDRMERDTVEAAGVATSSCLTFIELLDRELAGLRRTLRATSVRAQSQSGAKLGDFFRH
ncbi:MAG: NYN domain-containing protein [bacterium]